MLAFFVGGQRQYSAVSSICLKRALLVSKVTRYELECQRYPDLSLAKLETALRKQCFDYDVLLQHHHLHKEFEHRVRNILNECGIETRTVNRWGIKLIVVFTSVLCMFWDLKKCSSTLKLFVIPLDSELLRTVEDLLFVYLISSQMYWLYNVEWWDDDECWIGLCVRVCARVCVLACTYFCQIN
jgi:hypothetical protein